MDFDLNTIGNTTHNRCAGIVRIFLGGMFVMTGVMKLVVPTLREAFSGQLQAAGIPFHGLNMMVVPLVEVLVGVLLLTGFLSRVGAFVVIGLMVVATYVHLVVDDPTLFPLQPELPIIPIGVILMCGYLLLVGGGAWSRDLKQS